MLLINYFRYAVSFFTFFHQGKKVTKKIKALTPKRSITAQISDTK